MLKYILNLVYSYRVSIKYGNMLQNINSTIIGTLVMYSNPRGQLYTDFAIEDSFTPFKGLVRIDRYDRCFYLSTVNYGLCLHNFEFTNNNLKTNSEVYIKTNYNLQTVACILLNLNLIKRSVCNSRYFKIVSERFQNRLLVLFNTIFNYTEYHKIFISDVYHAVYIDKINILSDFNELIL